jgi:hypothetical protein
MTIEPGRNRGVLEGPVLGDVQSSDEHAMWTNIATGDHLACVEVRNCGLGRGLFATREIQAGERLFAFKGEPFGLKELKAMEDETYTLQVDHQHWIETLCIGAWINHSCKPNCFILVEGRGSAAVASVFAMKGIEEGEHVTYDYSTAMNEGRQGWVLRYCQCGSCECRGIVGDYLELPAKQREWYASNGYIPHFIKELLGMGEHLPAK